MKKKWLLILPVCLILFLGLWLSLREWNDPAHMSQERIYEELFSLENRVTLRLDMAPEELAKLQADYDRYREISSRSPIYRMGTLHVTILRPDGTELAWEIPQVGVRMKGNTSRTDFYNASEGIYNLIHLKLSFQETFDDPEDYGADALQWEADARKNRKARTFATLEKLDLRWNRCDDSTYLREYYAFETFRRNGVPAPRTNLADFAWAGCHMGVYTINEPVDKIFLEKNLPQSALGGDLYKIGWAGSSNGSFLDASSIGIENEDTGNFYAYDLKTNKKSSTHAALTRFISAMNSGTMPKEEFARWVDVDSFLSFAAVSYLLGNPDDLRNNYNNCYVYFPPDGEKAIFIPYDFDRCMGITMHWNPTHNAVTRDSPFSLRLLAIDANDTGSASYQRSPLFLYSVAEGGYYVREYAQRLREIAGSDWFCFDTFSRLYRQAENNYRDLTIPGKTFYNAQGLHLSFDLDRTSPVSADENISVAEYFQAKLETLDRYLEDTDLYATDSPRIVPLWYIRADFTNWQTDDSFVLHREEDLWVIRLTLSHPAVFKLYSEETSRWFGTECIAADCNVEYGTDPDTNIHLSGGSYRIAIHPDTHEITLEKE